MDDRMTVRRDAVEEKNRAAVSRHRPQSGHLRARSHSLEITDDFAT